MRTLGYAPVSCSSTTLYVTPGGVRFSALHATVHESHPTHFRQIDDHAPIGRGPERADARLLTLALGRDRSIPYRNTDGRTCDGETQWECAAGRHEGEGTSGAGRESGEGESGRQRPAGGWAGRKR